MSDYIFQRDPKVCPKCGSDTVPNCLPARCRGCGIMLFKSTDNLERYEQDTGWREYYVWTGRQEGWKHRSHLMEKDSKPLERQYKAPELASNYGTQDFINEKIYKSRMELRERFPQLKKKKSKVRP